MLLSDEIDDLISQLETFTFNITKILSSDEIENQQIDELTAEYKLRYPLFDRLKTIYDRKDVSKDDKDKIKLFFGDLKEIDEVNIHSIDSTLKIMADKIRLMNKSKNLKVYTKWR